MESDGVHKGKTPKLRGNDIWPHVHSMKKHGASACSDHTDVTFNYTILPMSAYTTEGLMLIGGIDMILKSLSSEYSIITVDVSNAHIVTLGEHFERFF
jgi:hypothetical protein